MSFNPNGDAGEYLVLAHLMSMGYEAGIIRGQDGDIVACINGVWRKFQVKAVAKGGQFGTGGPSNGGNSGQKRFTEYDVDAFVFCCMARLSPYYVHKNAVRDCMTLPDSIFGRQGRDMSWDDLLQRWGAPEKNASPQLTLIKNNDLPQLTLFKNDTLLRPL